MDNSPRICLVKVVMATRYAPIILGICPPKDARLPLLLVPRMHYPIGDLACFRTEDLTRSDTARCRHAPYFVVLQTRS